MRRALYRVDRPGSRSRLARVSEDMPPRAPGMVRVAVEAIGLNFADPFAILGLYEAAPTRDLVPGLEVAGRVLESDEPTLPPGTRVAVVTRFGGYATVVDAGPAYCAPLPDGWSVAEGAAFPVQALTAYYALVPLGALDAGFRRAVVLHSAAGGVGIQALRIARRIAPEARLIGTVGRAAKVEVAMAEGADAVVVRGEEDLRAALREAADGREVGLVLDAIGGDVFRASYRLLAPMGRLVVFGAADFATPGARPSLLRLAWLYLRRPRVDPLELIGVNKSVMGFNLIWLYDQVELLREMFDALTALALPAPRIGERFGFADLPDAVAALQSGRTVGKVVVEVAPEDRPGE